MKVKIDVTREHINKASSGAFYCKAGTGCPVYYATKDKVPQCTFVGLTRIFLGGDTEEDCRTEVPLPGVAKDAINKWDRSVGMEPFSFELELPDENQETEA